MALDIKARMLLNSRGFTKGIKNAGSAADGFAGKMSGLKGLIAGAFGIGAVVAIGKAGKAAISASAQFETLGVQFEVLLKNADAATAHMQDLAKMTQETPFQLGDLAEASRMLILFSDGAMGGRESLKMVGDAAGASGQRIEEVAFWVGRAYTAIKSGRPFGRAARRLQQMGLMTGKARNELEDMNDEGLKGEIIWSKFTDGFDRFEGGMDKLAGTIKGKTSIMSDNFKLLAKDIGDAMSDATKALIDAVIKWTRIGRDAVPGFEVMQLSKKLFNERMDASPEVANRFFRGGGGEEIEAMKRQAENDAVSMIAKRNALRDYNLHKNRPKFGADVSGGASEAEREAAKEWAEISQRNNKALSKQMFDRLNIADKIKSKEAEIAKLRAGSENESLRIKKQLEFYGEMIAAEGDLFKLVEKRDKLLREGIEKDAKASEIWRKGQEKIADLKNQAASDAVADRLGRIGGVAGGQANPMARAIDKQLKVLEQSRDIQKKTLETMNKIDPVATFTAE